MQASLYGIGSVCQVFPRLAMALYSLIRRIFLQSALLKSDTHKIGQVLNVTGYCGYGRAVIQPTLLSRYRLSPRFRISPHSDEFVWIRTMSDLRNAICSKLPVSNSN
jgi:hypothetical protein